LEETQLLSLIIILLALTKVAFADDPALQLVRDATQNQELYAKEAEELVANSEQLKHLYMSEAKELKASASQHILQASNPVKAPQTCGQSDSRKQSTIDTRNKYLIFVSFSMPKESLQSLYLDAEQHNAVLVIRGLKDGSFKKTTEELRSLKIAVQIDPKLFKDYQVTKVPTFVAVLGNQFNAITGNVAFGYAKSKLLGEK
jgi:type-F conjugative transfer system pilin assembly protein TrbC